MNVKFDQMFEKYLRLMAEHGLIRKDLAIQELMYAWSAASLGFYLIDPFSTEEFSFDWSIKPISWQT